MNGVVRRRVAGADLDGLLDAPVFVEELRAAAAQAGLAPADAHAEARRCLAELSVRPSRIGLAAAAGLARFLLTRSYGPQLDVNADAVAALQQAGGDRQYLFLWSHRSHMDSFAFMRALYDADFRPQPWSFAGINMRFPGMGLLGRRSGAVFLRRRFADDPVYKLVFRHVVDRLVAQRIPLSWSIEGTRSRSGRLSPPRLGLLHWVLESCQRQGVDDVQLVPVSIAFDQIAEIDDYLALQHGAPKRRESLRWFIGYLRGLQRPLGRVYLRFAPPLDASTAAALPPSLLDGDASGDPRELTRRLAVCVCERIEQATPLTPVAVVALVMLGTGGRALDNDEIRHHAERVRADATRRGLPVAGGLASPHAEVWSEALARLCDTRLVEAHSVAGRGLYRIAPHRVLAATYYRNTILHFFLAPACAELALAGLEPGTGDRDGALAQAVRRLRRLLRFEFYFPPGDAFLDAVLEDLEHRYPHWRDAAFSIDTLPADAAPRYGPATLRSFLESYAVLDSLLRAHGDAPVTDVEDWPTTLLAHGRAMHWRGELGTEAALSTAAFASALRLAGHLGLLSGEPDELRRARHAFTADVAWGRTALERLQRCAHAAFVSVSAVADDAAGADADGVGSPL